MERHEQIQLLAYFLWEKRGSPIGTPEVDWFRAEREFEEQQRDRDGEPLLVSAAKKIGSAFGTVAGAVETVVQK